MKKFDLNSRSRPTLFQEKMRLVGVKSRLFRLLVGVCLLCWNTSLSSACSVPVFRYAIEHWQPDAYIVTVFYRGSLTDQQQTWLKKLDGSTSIGSKPNTKVLPVNVDELSAGPLLEHWQRHQTDVLPAVVVDMPLSAPARAVSVWSGPLSESSVDSIATSALRAELEKRLLASESVVWIFMDGGNTDGDEAAFTLLQSEVARLEQSLELPKIEEEDLTALSVQPTELKIRFSVLRVPHNDPSESQLREMLMSIESDLRDDSLKGQPMAIPVFGRGRALYALTGPGINPATIEDACRFLTGACQCTVKAENPGVDLLLAADWDQLVKLSEPKELDTTLVKFALDGPKKSDATPTLPTDPVSVETQEVDVGNQTQTVSTVKPVGKSVWMAVGAIGLIAFFVSLAMFRRA